MNAKQTLIIQKDSEGKNVERKQAHVTRITHRGGWWHGYVTYSGRQYGTYSTNKSTWNLDLF